MSTVQEITEAIQKLSPADREKLVEELPSFLPELNDIDTEIETSWRREIDQRITEIESGKIKAVPLAESLSRARKIAGL